MAVLGQHGSAGHIDVAAGSIGGFVRYKDGVYALSNNHVFANEDRAMASDPVLQPSVLDGVSHHATRSALSAPTVRLTANGINRVDAALARLESMKDCEADTFGGN